MSKPRSSNWGQLIAPAVLGAVLGAGGAYFLLRNEVADVKAKLIEMAGRVEKQAKDIERLDKKPFGLDVAKPEPVLGDRKAEATVDSKSDGLLIATIFGTGTTGGGSRGIFSAQITINGQKCSENHVVTPDVAGSIEQRASATCIVSLSAGRKYRVVAEITGEPALGSPKTVLTYAVFSR